MDLPVVFSETHIFWNTYAFIFFSLSLAMFLYVKHFRVEFWNCFDHTLNYNDFKRMMDCKESTGLPLSSLELPEVQT